MTETHPTERRAYPRFEFPLHDEQRVTVGAFGGSRPTNGVVINISRGGVKVRLDRMVFGKSRGTERCGLHFPDAGEKLRPHSVIGIVRNVSEGEIERPFVAIEFGEPLEFLDLARQEPAGDALSASTGQGKSPATPLYRSPGSTSR